LLCFFNLQILVCRKLASLVLEAITTGHKQAEPAGQNGINTSTVSHASSQKCAVNASIIAMSLTGLLWLFQFLLHLAYFVCHCNICTGG